MPRSPRRTPARSLSRLSSFPYGKQVLWPNHCVQGTPGAAFHSSLNTERAQLVVRKGFHREVDSYSGFLEADRTTTTGLAGYLKEKGLRELFVCGLATDFCVGWTALDARTTGFEVAVVEDACRAIDLEGSLARAWREMADAGVRRVSSAQCSPTLKREWPLAAAIVTTALFLAFGAAWLADLSNPAWFGFMSGWLFAVILLASFAAVRHADAIAHEARRAGSARWSSRSRSPSSKSPSSRR